MRRVVNRLCAVQAGADDSRYVAMIGWARAGGGAARAQKKETENVGRRSRAGQRGKHHRPLGL